MQTAINFMVFDILKNILNLAEKPSELGKYITTQIRELIGSKTVILLRFNEIQKEEPAIIGICPERKKDSFDIQYLSKIATLSQLYHTPTIVSHTQKCGEMGLLLQQIGGESSIVVPLESASKRIGVLLMLDIIDLNNISSVLDSISAFSGVLAIELRNSQLFETLEYQVAQRTKELNESEERMRLAVENSPIPIMIHDEDDHVLLLSKGWTLFSGYTIDDIPMLSDWTIKAYGEKATLSKEYIDQLFEINKTVSNGEWKVITKSGDIRIWEFQTTPLGKVNKGKRVLQSMAIDITERKNSEKLLYEKKCEIEAQNEEYRQLNDELLLAKDRAEESDRLKTAFLQNMSHEIRTPMNAIMGFSELLPEQYNNRENIKYYTDIISQRSNDLLEIINDILDISKIESGQIPINYANCNLRTLFAEISSFFVAHQKRLNKQHININFRLQMLSEVTDSNIFIDHGKLKQILINLVGNALKFTDNGSIEFGCKIESNKSLLFYVSDTGIGIPLDKQSAIFDRFCQIDHGTKRIRSGTGLGLTIVKGLVELLNGKIWIESELEKGSTFYFTLPFQSAKVEIPENNKVERNQNYLFRGKIVLIVEDDIYNMQFLETILDETEITILKAGFGSEAIEIANSQKVDIILMDIRLPDMTGFEVTKQIKKTHPTIPIIAQTAYATLSDKEKAFESGCTDYISKPIKRKELMAMIDNILHD